MENTSWLNSKDNYLIYFGDTMCSWCYGFAEELSDLANANTDIPLKVVNGGLRPHGTTKNGDVVPEFGNQVMSEFLRHHWQEVNKRSGQPFSYAILDNTAFVYDTEPAARACVVAREMNPEIEFEFFKEVQKAFYAQGKNTNELVTFITVASKLGLDVDEFQAKFNSDDMKRATVEDFQLSANLGIKGFPSLVLKKGEEFFLIANGYNEAKNIQPVIDKIFSEN
ncbi:MAG: DsbA family protein [Crocinitomicaceae bacterium]|nr:DsbA family protein [Crocinitomicaceae bacterium]